MKLSSKRLTYLKCTEKGLDDYLLFGMNEAVMRYVTFKALVHKEAIERYQAALNINDKNSPLGYWFTYNKETKALIGYLKIIAYKKSKFEIGYLILPEKWGKGFASEITEVLIVYAKQVDVINELVGIVDIRNIVSKKVLIKQGFEYYKSEKDANSMGEYFKLEI